MHQRYGQFLRKVDRIARPKASAMRVQAHQLALATDELRRAADALHALIPPVIATSPVPEFTPIRVADPVPEFTPIRVADPVPVVADLNAQYDDQTRAVLLRIMRPGDSAVDVGAHEGLVLDYILEASPGGRHFAFEPIPHTARASPQFRCMNSPLQPKTAKPRFTT